jgi:hypothetical protein
MTALTWDQVGQRRYETGVDHGVLYIPDVSGDYTTGFAWNGLVSVTESPSGAESNKQYADNIPYLNLQSAEEFGATVEAFTYPEEFGQCDGTAMPSPGVFIGQQSRKAFGLCYRSKVGNDLNDDAGYKLHLIYSAKAAPSERGYTTVNDSPEPITFSWELTTVPIDAGVGYKSTAQITIDSTSADADALATLEGMLYGSAGVDPQLPSPADVLALFSGTVTEVSPTVPTYVSGTHTLTIPTQTGVEYKVNGSVITPGAHVITEDTLVTAHTLPGYAFVPGTDDDWFFDFS